MIADSQHAHVALMPEQLGDDGAERLVVTGHMYHDHDNSLSDVSTTTLALRRLAAARRTNR